MGEVGDWVTDAGSSFLSGMTGGIIDAKKGRFYVPGSSGQMRNWAKGYANAATAGTMRDKIDRAFNTPTAKLAGTAAGVVAGAAAGGGIGGAVGGTAGIATEAGSLAGGLAAASIAQADALNQQMPEVKAQKPLGNENTAVQKAVAEAASRRSRSRSGRSTILSQNFLSPSNPALKQTYGS